MKTPTELLSMIEPLCEKATKGEWTARRVKSHEKYEQDHFRIIADLPVSGKGGLDNDFSLLDTWNCSHLLDVDQQEDNIDLIAALCSEPNRTAIIAALKELVELKAAETTDEDFCRECGRRSPLATCPSCQQDNARRAAGLE